MDSSRRDLVCSKCGYTGLDSRLTPIRFSLVDVPEVAGAGFRCADHEACSERTRTCAVCGLPAEGRFSAFSTHLQAPVPPAKFNAPQPGLAPVHPSCAPYRAPAPGPGWAL